MQKDFPFSGNIRNAERDRHREKMHSFVILSISGPHKHGASENTDTGFVPCTSIIEEELQHASDMSAENSLTESHRSAGNSSHLSSGRNDGVGFSPCGL